MAKQNESAGQQSGAAGKSQGQTNQTGDPGRTPGAAEGDEQTVEEDLREKENKGQL